MRESSSQTALNFDVADLNGDETDRINMTTKINDF